MSIIRKNEEYIAHQAFRLGLEKYSESDYLKNEFENQWKIEASDQYRFTFQREYFCATHGVPIGCYKRLYKAFKASRGGDK